MIKNLPLSGINKKIANHSARKASVQTLKQNETPKFEIISVTGHNTEAGPDPYYSGDEEQQKQFHLQLIITKQDQSVPNFSFKLHCIS